MAGRTGIRIHAYALMGNHYHLVIETPKANLVDGDSKGIRGREPAGYDCGAAALHRALGDTGGLEQANGGRQGAVGGTEPVPEGQAC